MCIWTENVLCCLLNENSLIWLVHPPHHCGLIHWASLLCNSVTQAEGCDDDLSLSQSNIKGSRYTISIFRAVKWSVADFDCSLFYILANDLYSGNGWSMVQWHGCRVSAVCYAPYESNEEIDKRERLFKDHTSARCSLIQSVNRLCACVSLLGPLWNYRVRSSLSDPLLMGCFMVTTFMVRVRGYGMYYANECPR